MTKLVRLVPQPEATSDPPGLVRDQLFWRLTQHLRDAGRNRLRMAPPVRVADRCPK